MLKACIFDLDGVIVDTAKYHYIAWKRLANELGFDITEEENEALKGISRMGTLEIMLNNAGLEFEEDKKIELTTRKNKWYQEYISTMTKEEVLPGVIEFLEELKSKGIKIALGSASKNAGFILDYVDMRSYFEIAIDGTKTTKSKPDPQVFLMGAEGLGVAPNEAIVFEDGKSGIEAALAGGFTTVGIGKPEVLTKAHYVVSGLHEMNYEKAVDFFNKTRITA